MVGTALALKGSERIAVGILGDGDFLMGVTALWTATHYRMPCLLLVANNRSFYNDEMHQERVAKERSRPVENKWIGQRIDEPDIDLAMMARAQGAVGIGPVTNIKELFPAMEKAIEAVRESRQGLRRRRPCPARLRHQHERSGRAREALTGVAARAPKFPPALGEFAVLVVQPVDQQVAMGWVVYEITGSGALLGAVLGVRAIPILLLTSPDDLAARLAYLEGFGAEVIRPRVTR